MRSWLIAIRESEKVSQKTVAKKVGIAQPSYCNIELGARRPSVQTAKRIASFLGFNWVRFFEDDIENQEMNVRVRKQDQNNAWGGEGNGTRN